MERYPQPITNTAPKLIDMEVETREVKALHLASLQHVAEYMGGLEPVNGPLKRCREGDGIALRL